MDLDFGDAYEWPSETRYTDLFSNLGNTTSNLANTVSTGASWLGSNWQNLMPYGLAIGSALRTPKQPTVQYSQPPIPSQVQTGVDQLMKMASEGFTGPETWNRVLNRLMEQNVNRGLAPNATSGAMRKSLADAMTQAAEYDWQRKQGIYNTVGSLLGNYAPSPYLKQAVPSAWERLISGYLDMVNMTNLARVFNPDYRYNWVL